LLRPAAKQAHKPESLTTIAVNITEQTQVIDFKRIGNLNHIVSTAADIEGAYELLAGGSITFRGE
jgi:hypothetical protein